MEKQNELEFEIELNEDLFTAVVVCTWEQDEEGDPEVGYYGSLDFISLDWFDDIWGDILLTQKKYDEVKKYVTDNIENLFYKKMRG